jgi:hypothetical protein
MAKTKNGGRSDLDVYARARTAFVHCLESAGASVRGAARMLRVASSTVQRYRSGEIPVNPLIILRSPRLSRPFLLCLLSLERRKK